MTSLLPAHGGLLPSWLLLTSAASVLNTVSCYTSRDAISRLYQGKASGGQVTDVSARLFGTWTLLAAIVRTYAAYKIDSNDVYAMAFLTYVIAFAYFSSEWLFYGTMKISKGLGPSFVIASGTTVWMYTQWPHYTEFVRD